MGSLPAKSAIMSKLPALDGGSRCSTASARMRGLELGHPPGREGLGPSERIRVWGGGSMARNDIDRWA